MKSAHDRQKNYADKRPKKLEFQVDDLVFLRVSPTLGVVCFGVVGKLRPHYIRSFKILNGWKFSL